MIKVSVHQEDKCILNVCMTINIFQNTYTWTKLRRIERFTIKHTDINTPLSVTNSIFLTAAKLIKDTGDLNKPTWY